MTTTPSVPAHLEKDLLEGFAARHIARRARQLIGKARLTLSDIDDIEQHLRLELWKRMDRFDPDRSPWEAFVTAIVDRCVATFLKKRRAQKQQESHPMAYLSAPVPGEDHELTELGRMVRPDQQDFLVPRSLNDHQEGRCCEQDVAAVIAALPPELKTICELLPTMSQAKIGRTLQLPHSTVRDRIRRIREIFHAENLDEYLRGSP